MATATKKPKMEKVQTPKEAAKSNQKIKAFEVSADVLQATVNYLGSKPFAEVSQLIQALSQSKPIAED